GAARFRITWLKVWRRRARRRADCRVFDAKRRLLGPAASPTAGRANSALVGERIWVGHTKTDMYIAPRGRAPGDRRCRATRTRPSSTIIAASIPAQLRS